MYKKIKISDIIGSIFIDNIRVNNFPFEKLVLIENEIANKDSFIQIDCSVSERKRAEYLGEKEIWFTPHEIILNQEISFQVKNRFIRCYYGLDDDCKKALTEAMEMIAEYGER